MTAAIQHPTPLEEVTQTTLPSTPVTPSPTGPAAKQRRMTSPLDLSRPPPRKPAKPATVLAELPPLQLAVPVPQPAVTTLPPPTQPEIPPSQPAVNVAATAGAVTKKKSKSSKAKSKPLSASTTMKPTPAKPARDLLDPCMEEMPSDYANTLLEWNKITKVWCPCDGEMIMELHRIPRPGDISVSLDLPIYINRRGFFFEPATTFVYKGLTSKSHYRRFWDDFHAKATNYRDVAKRFEANVSTRTPPWLYSGGPRYSSSDRVRSVRTTRSS